MWRAVKAVPEDWERAVAYDESIRDIRPGFKCFVYSGRIALKDADLSVPVQGRFDDECFGICERSDAS